MYILLLFKLTWKIFIKYIVKTWWRESVFLSLFVLWLIYVVITKIPLQIGLTNLFLYNKWTYTTGITRHTFTCDLRLETTIHFTVRSHVAHTRPLVSKLKLLRNGLG